MKIVKVNSENKLIPIDIYEEIFDVNIQKRRNYQFGTVDANGDLNIHTMDPKLDELRGMWYSPIMQYIANVNIDVDWEKSLIKLKY